LFTEWESRTTLVVEECAGDTGTCVIKVEEVLGDLAMISVGMPMKLRISKPMDSISRLSDLKG